MRADAPRLMIAGSGSGSGKTTLSCGILAAFKKLGLDPAAFKCGPDYIDPMFHTEVLGLNSCNLDIFMCGEEAVRFLLARNARGHGLSVIEGVMGLYDGQGAGDYGSSNHLATLTGTPQVLVVNTRGEALTLAARLYGYLNFAPNNIKGVIFNNTTEKMYAFYRDMVEERLGLKAYGWLPPMPEAAFSSRRLGLITPAETAEVQTRLEAIAEACLNCLDIKGLAGLARSAAPFEYSDMAAQKLANVNIAVARDKAFCFYYRDNLELLRELGARLEFFSPLDDAALPENIDGLILGGGYPEEHVQKLSANSSMLASVKNAGESGLPVLAECGGFMYLCRSLKDGTGREHPMSGLVGADAFMTETLGRFGYITLTAGRDNFLCRRSTVLRGHEFHYSDSTAGGDAFKAVKSGGRNWPCVHASGPEDRLKIFAGYPHFHFRGNPDLAASFVKACAEYAKGRGRG